MTTGRFHHPGPEWGGTEETIVVGAVTLGVRRTTLAIVLDQDRDDLKRFIGVLRPFQPQAQQIHADQGAVFVRLPGEDGLVADGDAPLVDADLESPEPVGSRSDNLPGFGNLRNLDV